MRLLGFLQAHGALPGYGIETAERCPDDHPVVLAAGVAGLNANATRLATIADNIANSGTYGYKRPPPISPTW